MQLPNRAPDDILDALEPAALPVHAFPWLQVLVITASVVLVALAVYAWKRRRRPVVTESLEQVARRRLKELHTGDPRTLHTELAAILTDYAEHRLGLRGSRLTSAEILREFRKNGVMSAAWQDSLAAFFCACDHAKFAPTIDPCDAGARIVQCRALIDELAASAAATSKLADPWQWAGAAQ
jgi:hypothetical protein